MGKIATIKEAYETSEMAGSSDSNKCITKSEARGIANLEIYGDYEDNQLVQLSDLHQEHSVCVVSLQWNDDTSDGGYTNIDILSNNKQVFTSNVSIGSGSVKVYRYDDIIVRFGFRNSDTVTHQFQYNLNNEDAVKFYLSGYEERNIVLYNEQITMDESFTWDVQQLS